jgi:tetratricopeptide (TPR) repeat protein
MRFIILIFSALLTGCSANKTTSSQEWEAQKSTLDSLIRKTQYDNAIKMAQDRIEIAERSNTNDFQLSNAYSDLGLIYQQMGRYDFSKTYFEKSLSTYPSNGVVHYNYGLLYREMANYDKAWEEFQLALDIYKKDNNKTYKKHSPTLVEFGIAGVLTRTLQLDSAKKLTDKVIFSATNYGDSAILYSAKINLSLIHLYSKDFKSAKDSYYDVLNNYPTPNSQEYASLLHRGYEPFTRTKIITC